VLIPSFLNKSVPKLKQKRLDEMFDRYKMLLFFLTFVPNLYYQFFKYMLTISKELISESLFQQTFSKILLKNCSPDSIPSVSNTEYAHNERFLSLTNLFWAIEKPTFMMPPINISKCHELGLI